MLPYTERQLFGVALNIKDMNARHEEVVCVSREIVDTWKCGTVERCVFKWGDAFYEVDFTISYAGGWGRDLCPHDDDHFPIKRVRPVTETCSVTRYVGVE